MLVQRYYTDGTRPAAQAPWAIDRALFGVRDFLYQDGNLYSTWLNHTWSPGGEEHARCLADIVHRAPHPQCTCGLYSFYNRQGALKYGDGYVRGGSGVRGVVSAWGDIVLHESGFRSEYMRLEALIYEPNAIAFLGEGLDVTPVYEQVSKRLEVPLIIPEEIGSFARERGLFVLNEQASPEAANTWQLAGSLPGKRVESGVPARLAKDPREEMLWVDPSNYTNPQWPIPPAGTYRARVVYSERKLQPFQWGL